MATPVLAPRIDYGLVSPLDYAQTVSYINNFVFETAEFLNKFASLCDRKLEKVGCSYPKILIPYTGFIPHAAVGDINGHS